MNQFRKNIKTLLTFRWQPGQDTLVALVTAVLMIPIYYAGAHIADTTLNTLIFGLLGNVVLSVLFPVYYLLRLRGEQLDELGITTRRWWLAALLSLALSAISWFGLVRIPLQSGASLLPQILVNGLMLWEPFLVFGWLQLRFERAFGILPGILLAGLAMGAYHLGTFGLSGVLIMAVFGISFGAVFRVTRNLLSMWPLTWAICASIGTLNGGIFFHWSDVFIYAVILAIQLVGITVIVMLTRKYARWKEVQL